MALLLSLVTACGSTVAGSSALGSGGGQGAAAPGLGPASAAQGAAGDGLGGGGGGVALTGGQAATDTTASPGRAASTAVVGTGTSSSSSPLPTGATSPGVTATTINIGINYIDTAAANSAVQSTGAKGSSAGDMLAEQRAIAAWLNARGGVAGRRINLIVHKSNINDDISTMAQATCSDWTEDHKVFAGIGAAAGFGSGPLVACLAKHGTVAIGTGYDVGSDSDFNRFRPYYYGPSSMEMGAVGRSYAQGLVDQRFFAPGAKPGIVAYDAPEFHRAMSSGVLPALRAAGVTVPDTYWITPPNSLSDEGALVSAIQSAVLKFRSDGVSHVMFLDGNSSITYFFIKQAQSQGYSPRYGLSTLSYPSFVQSNFGADVLHGTLGVGWMPTEDVDVAHLPANEARRLCQSIMTAAGLEATAETDLTVQLYFCSEFFLLKAGLEGARELTPSAFRDQVARLGTTSYTSAAGLVDSFSAGKAWGAANYRYLKYDDACACFTYYGQLRPAR
jgi:hypothetical protein